MSSVLRHGKLSLEVPEDWTDRSTLVLVAPPTHGLAVPQSGKPAPQYATNVVVSFVPNDGSQKTARAFAEELGRGLLTQGVRFKELGAVTLQLGQDEAFKVTRELERDGMLVVQEAVVLMRPSLIVLATATMERSTRALMGPIVEQVLESLRLEAHQ